MSLGYKLASLQNKLYKLESNRTSFDNFPVSHKELFGNSLAVQTDETSELVLSGAAGTGKSVASLYKMHHACIDNPGIRCLIVRKTRSSLAESGLHTFENNILGYNHPLLAGATRQNRQAYVYPNGSRLVVGGMDKSSRIMSSDFDLIFVQEATEVSEEDWDALLSRLRNYKLPYQQIMADCNPQSEQHWIYQRSIRGGLKLLKSVHEDNPMLFDHATGTWTQKGLEYLAKLDNLSGVRYQRLRLGLWVAAEGMVYEEFDRKIHVVRGALPPFKRFISGVDWGHRDAGCIVTVGETYSGQLILVDEVYRTGQTLDFWIQAAHKIVAKYNPEVFACDPSLLAHIQAFKAKGIPAIKGMNRIKFGVDLVAQRIKAKTLLFHESSLKYTDPNLADTYLPTRTIDEIEGYVWDDKKDNPVDTNSHGLDALRYCVVQYDRPKSDLLPATSVSTRTFKSSINQKMRPVRPMRSVRR